MQIIDKNQIEYGDFQTPLELAEKVCKKLIEIGVNPNIIIEPTCGTGNFIETASHLFTNADKIIGMEINSHYLQNLQKRIQFLEDQRIEVYQADFFQFSWLPFINNLNGKILILGNFPWVTNAQQGVIKGQNLPQKNNFQNYQGLDAITGKSNFDISEWMLIQVIQWLQKRDGYIAMLCKTSISRKLLNYIYKNNLYLDYCATYKINVKKYFGVSVEACLLFCQIKANSHQYFCDVFDNLTEPNYTRISYKNNCLIKNISNFENLRDLYDKDAKTKWRSGIKHDCSKIMELRKINNNLVNGLGEIVDIEDTYIFPLLKGSDIAQGRIETTERYVLVTQNFVGQPTEEIKILAPKTWDYLESHTQYFNNRKSKIYQNQPRFAIFGVGLYTFLPWKIVICGLYKKLEFRLIGNLLNKPVIFDDTIYFLAFDEEKKATKTFEMLTSPAVIDFYSSLIFWDEKRPIKASILNKLKLNLTNDQQTIIADLD